MFANFFIRRPVFASVSAMLIVLAGAAVIPTLPIAQFPNLAPPQVTVSSFYIGASAQTVESAVTIPLEQQINGAEGMKYITSTSGNDGSSGITVTAKVLERFGVERYSALGASFDPARHEAVSRVVSPEHPENTVVGETLRGYALNGRVLRPALVTVSTAPDGDA